MVSGALVEDEVLGRLAISHRETDGHYTNTFTGADDAIDYLEDTSLRGRMIWNVSDDLKLDFRGGYSEVKGGAINFNATFAVPLFSDILPGNSPTYFQDVNDADFVFTANVPGENEQETLDLSVKADWNLGFADLVASVSYNDLDEYLLSDGTSASFYGYEVTPALYK